MRRAFDYNTSAFIKDASERHGGFYDYTKAIYVGHTKNIEIICPIHGSFFQGVYRHLKGKGCRKCGHKKRVEKWRTKYIESDDIFIKKFYAKYGSQFCAEVLNKSVHVIRFRAYQLGVKRNSPKLNHAHVPGRLWANLLSNTKHRGLSLEITPDDIYELYIKQNKKCALTGRPMTLCNDSKISEVSIDRINNTKGYTVTNIQLVHKIANQARMDMTINDFYQLCRDVYLNLTK